MNYMYDVNRDNHFLMLPNVNSSYSYWWEEAEPFWATAIKNNRKTALYYWPDGHENHHGVQPSFSLPYKFTDDLRAFRGHLDDALQDLKDNTIDVALIYSEYIDFIGHTLGPDSHELKSAVKDVDKEIQELISNLHRFKLIDKVS